MKLSTPQVLQTEPQGAHWGALIFALGYTELYLLMLEIKHVQSFLGVLQKTIGGTTSRNKGDDRGSSEVPVSEAWRITLTNSVKKLPKNPAIPVGAFGCRGRVPRKSIQGIDLQDLHRNPEDQGPRAVAFDLGARFWVKAGSMGCIEESASKNSRWPKIVHE